ncbi:hypothetical protein AVEN_191060-1 [Araneus ventricosus]|uniref:Uncharacterized protein n=1 Tax=Araneus ventricosus TaxID=182803 RepID=A0A4Y2AX08_ARAVE|nr:hypothetical protein AVEN_191060-1 [Araneus ventricosus]
MRGKGSKWVFQILISRIVGKLDKPSECGRWNMLLIRHLKEKCTAIASRANTDTGCKCIKVAKGAIPTFWEHLKDTFTHRQTRQGQIRAKIDSKDHYSETIVKERSC